MELTGKRVVVTGGAGFIGSHVVDELLARGDVREITVLDTLRNGRLENLPALGRDPRLRLVRGDVTNGNAVEGVCDGVQVIFHLACLGVRHSLHSPLENQAVNANGTLTVLLAATRSDVERFVHVSSSEVFGTAQYVPMDEQHPRLPETVYGASKLAGEALARASWRSAGLPVAVVRPFNNFGPRSHFEGDSGEVIPRTIVRLLCGLPPVVFGDGEQTRDFLHVRDTARALIALAECDEAVGQMVNIGSGRETTINEVCRLVADATGRTDLTPEHQDPRPGDVRRLWVDNSMAHRLIGFRPSVRLADGIGGLVEWFRQRSKSPEEMLALMTERNWVETG